MGSAPIYFNRAGTHLSAVSSVGRDTTALIRIEMATGAEQCWRRILAPISRTPSTIR